MQFSGRCNYVSFISGCIYYLTPFGKLYSISQSVGLPSDDDNKTILINHWILSGIGINNVWSSLINHYI